MRTPMIDIESLSDRLVFIHLAITCWTGKRHLQPQDLGLDRHQLPPEKLVALGNKCVIDPQEIQVFTTCRAAARRECLAVGTRFLNGFMVPDEKTQGLLDRLGDIEQTFNQERDRFLAKFDRLIEDWVAAHPAWETLLRDSGVTRTFVAERLAFAVQAFKIVTPDTVTHPGLAEATAGLADNLFTEVAQLARDTLEKSYLGKTAVTRRALRPLLALQQKLDGLAFLDRRVRPIVQSIEETLVALPRKGTIQDRDLQALIGLLSILEDPQRLKAHGEELLDQAADEASSGFTLDWPTASSPFSADDDDSEDGEDGNDTEDSEDSDDARNSDDARDCEAIVTETVTAEADVSAERQEETGSHTKTDEVDNPRPSEADRSSVATETPEPADWFF